MIAQSTVQQNEHVHYKKGLYFR